MKVGLPVQVPCSQMSVCPTAGVPDIEGAVPVLIGATVGTGTLRLLDAAASVVPLVLVAIASHVIVLPASPLVTM